MMYMCYEDAVFFIHGRPNYVERWTINRWGRSSITYPDPTYNTVFSSRSVER